MKTAGNRIDAVVSDYLIRARGLDVPIYADTAFAGREVAEGAREAHENLWVAAEAAREVAGQAREVLTELTELARRMRVATEAQEALVEELRQRRSS